MHARTAAAATAALLLAVTACQDTNANDDTRPAASTTPPTPKSSAPSSPSVSPRPAPLAFGQPVTTNAREDGSTATATVLGYQQGSFQTQQSADDENGTTGYVWAALEIKVCSTKGTVNTSRFPWVLAYADGTRIEPSGTTYGDFPKPEYPFEAKVKEGDCVRGKTVYAVPSSQRPARVLYTTQLLPEPAEWTVPSQ